MTHPLCRSHSFFNLSKEEMQALGYQAIDMIVEHFLQKDAKGVAPHMTQEIIQEFQSNCFSMKGENAQDIVQYIEQNILKHITHVDHKRFFAFVPGPSNYISVIGDLLASGYNVFTGSWLEAPAASEIELNLIQWLNQQFGYSTETSGGVFVSGGSMANLSAIALAKEVKLKGVIDKAVIYCSTQTHSSVDKCLKILGFKEYQIHKIKVDHSFCVDIPSLEQAILQDREEGLIPFCIVANSGTTNTGAIDSLEKISQVAQQHDLWMHVDGAYGGAIILTEEGKRLLQGINHADSITIDPHKWLFQPYEMGCLLVKDKSNLVNLFRFMPEYLEDIYSIKEAVNLCDYGIQLTRNFKALKLWFSLKVFGVERFTEAIQYGIKMAQYTESVLNKSGCWEIVSPANIGIITFRYIKQDFSPQALDDINKMLVHKLIETGFAMISTTKLHHKLVLRMCTINPSTTEEDIDKTVEILETQAEDLATCYANQSLS